MKKKFILISLLSLIIILAGYQIAHTAYGLEDTAKAADLMKITDVRVFIGNIIGTVLSLVGVIFFVLMLYGGFVWMTARGNQESEKSALGTIMGAVIGIIIVLAAYAITNFVFSNIKSASGTTTITTTTPS